MMKYVIVITGASSGFGALAARAPRKGRVVTAVLDRIRTEFVRCLGFADLLHPAKLV